MIRNQTRFHLGIAILAIVQIGIVLAAFPKVMP